MKRAMVAAAWLSTGLPLSDAAADQIAVSASHPAVVVFQAAGFPTVDAPPIAPATLEAALQGLPVETADTAAALGERLKPGGRDVLLLAYGSAFPAEAWPAIRAFLENGGGLVVLGGAPFHQPVRQEGGQWVLGPRHPTYARALLIGPADRWVRGDQPATTVAVGEGWTAAFPEPATVYALTVRLARRRDPPDEHGATGPRDAVLRPLVHVRDADGIPRAAPLIEIDRLRGDDEGARWVLAPCDAALPAPVIRAAVERALQGAVELAARPVRAAVDAGQAAEVRIVLTRPAPRPGEPSPASARVTVHADDGRRLFSGPVTLSGPAEARTAVLSLPASRRPGLYHVAVTTPDAPWWPRTTTTGFWVRDRKLMAAGPRLTVSRDWLRQDGRVFPVVGTTYMASDVHRRFLFEPNPHVWDADFAEMKRRGVNFVRTGLWTGWSRAMLDPGAVDEALLSALDAFVLTAARHQVPVCFTFYAFLPPAHGGTHPYLDPRAREGQRHFLTQVASRYRGVPWVHWDLINEPSYAPPHSLWKTRPIGDVHERRAFEAWARRRHGDDLERLRGLWRDVEPGLFEAPLPEEFETRDIREGRPRKVRDFLEFTNDVVAEWAARSRDVLRAASGDLLVTLGQDEGGTARQPAQHLHAHAVDYTAVHTWWANDDLLWLGVATKAADRPNLHQETGLMRLEDEDGNAWRTPEDAAALLERKLAYAFASRGAGAVEWVWNVNPYQPIDNESVIGLVHPDGTAKPELDVLSSFAAFFRDAAPWLDDFESDPVVLVVPHSRLFLGRPGGLEPARVVTRMLAERFGVVPRAVSELRLTAAALEGARLVIVPAPEVLADGASRALLDASRAGTRVLVTGAVLGNPYGEETAALRELGLIGETRPVAFRETSPWAGEDGWVSFSDGLAGQHLRRGAGADLIAPDGMLTGNVWHEPLPLELAREREPLARLLQAALASSGVEMQPSSSAIALRLLTAPRAVLGVCVNETAADGDRRVTVEGRAWDVPVRAGRSRLVLFERGTGRVVLASPGAEPRPAAQ